MAKNEQTETVVAVLNGYLTLQQLAAQLGKSVRTIRRWEVRHSGPPRITVGHLILYNVDSVRQWLAEHEQRRGPRERSDRT